MPRVDLPIRLPEGVQGKHRAQHLLEFLDTHPGVSMAEIDQNQSTLRLQFDSDRLHLSEVEAIARDLGADLGKQFHHCLMYLGKPRCRDGTESLEREITKLQGVSHVSANPAASSIVVEYGDGDLTPAQIEQRVHRLGYEARRDFLQLLWEDWSDSAWSVACGFFLIAGVVAEKLGASDAGRVLMFMLSYVAGGHIAALEAIRSLRSGRFDVNFLMIAAAIGAAIINQWMEGAILLFLFSLSNTLKSYALGKTRKAIHSLIALKPQHALLKIGNVERRVPVETLKIGDVVLVKPGERIAADGIVIGGYSAVDQSAFTGESMPVEKNVGHQVFAGTLNGGGSLTVEVIKLASDTTLARIIELYWE